MGNICTLIYLLHASAKVENLPLFLQADAIFMLFNIQEITIRIHPAVFQIHTIEAKKTFFTV
jgi:hypothetical protein